MERFPLLDKTLQRTVIKHRRSVQVLLFACSVVWIFLFPLICISSQELKCRGTYMSENALMPGEANKIVHESDVKAADDLDRHMIGLAQVNDSAVLDTFLRYGATSAFLHEYYQFKDQPRKNYVGILRPAPGGDRREAILLVTSLPKIWFSSLSLQNSKCCSGLSLLLVLLQRLQKVDWLSKNVVLLVSESEYGVHEFLKDYHDGSSSGNGSLAANMEVGRFAAGVVLQLERPLVGVKLNTLTLATQGINGQLPNLDLFNVASRVVNARKVMDGNRRKLNVLRQVSKPFGEVLAKVLPVRDFGYPARMENVFRFMHRLAFSPTGWHSQLLPYRIDSLSFVVKNESFATNQPEVPLLAVIVGIQQVVRSISNLDEKLHQSFYLYVLPDLDMFVSINEYAGPMVLVLSPIILDVCYLIYPQSSALLVSERTNPLSGFIYAVGLLMSVALAGVVLCAATSLKGFTPSYNCDTLNRHATVWTIGFVAISSIVVVTGRKLSNWVNSLGHDVWMYSKLGLYGAVFLGFTILGVFNFSLAWFTALVTVPTYRMCCHTSSRTGRLAMIACWALSCPVTLLWVFAEVFVEKGDKFWLAEENTGCSSLDEFNPLSRALAILMVAFHRFNDLRWLLLSCLLVPLHLLALWMIAVPIREKSRRREKTE